MPVLVVGVVAVIRASPFFASLAGHTAERPLHGSTLLLLQLAKLRILDLHGGEVILNVLDVLLRHSWFC